MKVHTVKEVLIAAKWILENIGWNQNDYYRSKSGKRFDNHIDMSDVASACSAGAIYLVEADVSLQEDTVDYLLQTIGGSVSRFNDAPSTTKEDVLAVFQKAIERT